MFSFYLNGTSYRRNKRLPFIFLLCHCVHTEVCCIQPLCWLIMKGLCLIKCSINFLLLGLMLTINILLLSVKCLYYSSFQSSLYEVVFCCESAFPLLLVFFYRTLLMSKFHHIPKYSILSFRRSFSWLSG